MGNQLDSAHEIERFGLVASPEPFTINCAGHPRSSHLLHGELTDVYAAVGPARHAAALA